MILNGNQRGGAKDLALHLMKAENEVVELHELRGFLSCDLMGALNEAYAISRGTKCKQFLYSLSLNPPKDAKASVAAFEAAIEQAERRLGLQGQPRAVVFHVKDGRRHCHVVWSRIDVQTMTARQMSHDWEKLTDLSRELYVQHSWEMPDGIEKRGERDPTNYTYAEHQQAQRVGKNAAQIKAEIQAAWEASDTRIAFEHALAEKGYVLARGDQRGFVVMDEHGEIYSLPKQLPKGINTRQVRERLGDPNELPSVEEVLAQLQLQREAQPAYNKDKALAQVERYHAAFTPAMMERTLKPHIKDGQERKRMIQDIVESDNVVHIGERAGKPVYTTNAMIELERCMMQTAQQMAQRQSHNMDDHAVQRAIFNLNNTLAQETNGTASLSHEQQQAVRHMTGDKQLSLVVGVAGAGKTTIMQGAKDALEAQGYRVRGAAPSGVAASGLHEIGMTASTLHSLEYRIQLAQQMMDENAGKPLTPKQSAFIQSAMLTRNDVLIVDEAGMVSVRQLARIMELCQKFGAKLVLVGDPQQLQSVEAGAAFRTLLERNDSVSLTEVRRQSAGWQREATMQLSEGNVEDALQSYNKHGCIVQAKSRNDAKVRLVQGVIAAHEQAPDSRRLVLAYTRKDVADLNVMIKAAIVKRGAVSPIDKKVRITMQDGDEERTETQGFAIGDRILFRENNKEMGVMNGTFGTLKNLSDGRFHVRLDNGNIIAFHPNDYSRFQLGYAATVHKSQGVTVDETYVLATPHFDRYTTYVALSRHKQQVKLYTNRNAFKTNLRLHAALGKQGTKLSTLDFTDPQQKWEHTVERRQQKTGVTNTIKQLWQRLRKHAESPLQSEQQHDISSKVPQPEPQHQHSRSISQQDFITLRDEFVQQIPLAQHNTDEYQHQHNRHPRLERGWSGDM